MLIVFELPPVTEPLPVTFCNVDGGRTEISVTSRKVSPKPVTAIFTLLTATVGYATT